MCCEQMPYTSFRFLHLLHIFIVRYVRILSINTFKGNYNLRASTRDATAARDGDDLTKNLQQSGNGAKQDFAVLAENCSDGMSTGGALYGIR